MIWRGLTSIVAWLWFACATGTVAADDFTEADVVDPPAGKWAAAPSATAKPTAPIDVRWLAAGEDGTIALQLVAGVDYVGATIRVTAPGLGRPLEMQLPAAAAGEIQTAEWAISQTLRQRPHATINIDTRDGTVARTAVATMPRGKSHSQPGSAGPMGGPVSGGKVSGGDSRTEELLILPAEQTVRRTGDGSG